MRSVLAMTLVLGTATFANSAESWESAIKEHLSTLGHRNWIVVADSAYPDQVAPGVKTIYVGGDQLKVVDSVLNLIRKAPHVRPVVYTDAELPHVSPSDAPGIRDYRKKLSATLGEEGSIALPHGAIIETLDEAGQSFRVVILKTDLTLPYTSVFFRLDAGYWSDAAEQRLRQRMFAVQKRGKPMEPIEDEPHLPRVLLIGDSISIGYTVPVRRLLSGIANVHRPLTNCGPTTKGVQNLDAWLGDKPWDIIHFNFGLHDLKYINSNGERVPPSEGHLQVPPNEYEVNLTKIVKRLQNTNAKLIWRTTTPVPKGAHGRVPGDAAKYNEIAARVIRKTLGKDAVIDDQFAFAMKRLTEIQRPADVHFTPEGSDALAKQTAKAILSQLPNKP